MPHGFDFFHIFVSAPGDLETDRQVCHDVIAATNEAVAMPEKILLTEVALRDNSHLETFRAAVSDNVRWCTYFIQFFQDDWGPRDLFRKLFFLAQECRDNPETPMREIIVCLKNAPHETDAQILGFRKELEESPAIHLIRYKTPDEIKAQLKPVLTNWAQALVAEKTAVLPGL